MTEEMYRLIFGTDSQRVANLLQQQAAEAADMARHNQIWMDGFRAGCCAVGIIALLVVGLIEILGRW